MKRFFFALLLSCSLLTANAQLDKPYFYLRGRDYIMDGQYREAIESLNLLLRSLPKEYEGYFLRGVAKYNLDDLSGALQDFTSAISHNPVYTMAYQYRGITHSRMGQYDEALTDFAYAIDMRPNYAPAYYSRAVTNFLNQQFRASIEDYNQFLRIEPRDPQAYVNRGTSYLYVGDTTSALKNYDRAIAINPYISDGYLRRGLLSLVRGQTNDGIQDMDRTIAIDSTHSIAYFYRAMGYNTLGKLNNALADFDNSIHYDSTNSVSYFNRALLRTQVGDYNRAIEDYTRVAQSNPRNVLVYYNRASVNALLGNLRGAVNDYSRAIDLYPDFANAYLRRSSAKLHLGDRRGAMADHAAGERIIKEYRTKMTPEKFESLADTSAQFSDIMSFDADFGNKDFSRLQGSRESQITPQPLYMMMVASPDTVIGYRPTRYASARLERFVRDQNIDGLALRNRPTDLDVNDVLVRDSTLQNARSWNELFEKAVLQSVMSQYSSAMELYNFLVAERPTDPFSLMNRATTRAAMIEFMASLQGDYQSININSDPAARLKTAEKRIYDYSEVVADLRAAIRLMPEFPHLYFNLGNILAKQNDMTGALEAYTKAIELFPYFDDAYFNRAVVQILVGEIQKGCLDLSKAGELGIAKSYEVLKKYCLKK
ncbi:MAG: tetratricopeptide repeat protein [Mucinivorans sp.]